MLKIDASVVNSLHNVGFPLLRNTQVRLAHDCILHILHVIRDIKYVIVVLCLPYQTFTAYYFLHLLFLNAQLGFQLLNLKEIILAPDSFSLQVLQVNLVNHLKGNGKTMITEVNEVY